MISNSKADLLISSPYIPEKDSLTVSYFKNQEFRAVPFETVFGLTIRELCSKPFIFRFDVSREGRVYFTEFEQAFLRLQNEGKQVRWFHELMEYWRQDLIFKGFPKDISIYHWRLKDISVLQKALIVFKGSEVEVRQ